MNDHRRMFWRPAFAAAALALVANNAQAEPPIVADDAPATAVSTCVPCHGPTGQGQQSEGIPRLAGMSAKYLEAQMLAYRNGRRSDPVMEQVAKQLEATDIATLAAHFASQPVVDGAAAFAAASASAASASNSVPATADGEALAKRGNWKKGVPACAQCHAPDGLGVGDSFPQIAGQPAIYIANQLQAWKARRRNTDPMGLMRGVASSLSAAEISAVAAWYAALPAVAAPAIPVKPAKPPKPAKAARPSSRRQSKP